MKKFGASPQWAKINRELVAGYSDSPLESFRREGLSMRYSGWPVWANAVRFFKTMLYNEMLRLDDSGISLLAAIPNRHFGNPITVRVRGVEGCIDYLLAVKKILFLDGNWDGFHTVMEIGAGYGRTCHAILATQPAVERYIIVDLAPSLEISRRYLAQVLPPAQFAKIRFMDTDGFETAPPAAADLVININSMAEMDVHVVDAYLDYINGHAGWFYVNNPVAKYTMASLESQEADPEAVQKALAAGKLKTIIDIFDAADIEANVQPFLEAYQPGPDWAVKRHAPAWPWSYYHQALYQRDGGRRAAKGEGL
jgi:hypothetical protein